MRIVAELGKELQNSMQKISKNVGAEACKERKACISDKQKTNDKGGVNQMYEMSVKQEWSSKQETSKYALMVQN